MRRVVGRVKTPRLPGRYTVRDTFFPASFEEAHQMGEILGALGQDDRSSPP